TKHDQTVNINARYNIIISKGILVYENGKLFNINKITAKICETVLSLPILLAANTTPSPEATKRKPVIANSLLIITITIQTGAICNSISIIKAADTSNLSANGSKNFPIFVIRLYFLAM